MSQCLRNSILLCLCLTAIAAAQGIRSAPVRTTPYTRSLLYPPADAPGVRNVLGDGDYYDVDAYANLAAAIADISTATAELHVHTAQTLTASVTIPATIALVIHRGGSIAKASTYTLAINGELAAGAYEIFTGFAAGGVTFGTTTGVVRTLHPEWWQHNTTPGTTDMLLALQSALACVGAWQGATIPIGAYAISDTLSLKERGVTLQGHGWGSEVINQGSWIKWIGSAGSPMLQIEDCIGMKLSNFRLIGDSANDPSYGIFIQEDAGAGSVRNTFEQLHIGMYHVDAEDYDAQIDVGVGIGGSAGNDSNKWDMISIWGCPIGIEMTNSQAINNHWSNLFIHYASTAAIKTTTSMSGTNWFFALNEIDIWYYNTGAVPIVDVTNWGSEAAGRFALFTGGGTLHVHGGYWQARNTYINADHKFIKAENAQRQVVILEDWALTESPGYSEATPTITMKTPGGSVSRNVLKVSGRSPLAAVNVDMECLNQASNESWIDVEAYGASGVMSRWTNWVRYKDGTAPELLVDDTRQDTFSNFKIQKGLYYEIYTLANDGTPSVADGTIWLTGGTTTITDFDDGVEGQEIKIIAEHSLTITDGTNIFLSGSGDFVMVATDTLTLICKIDNKWYEVARSDNT